MVIIRYAHYLIDNDPASQHGRFYQPKTVPTHARDRPRATCVSNRRPINYPTQHGRRIRDEPAHRHTNAINLLSPIHTQGGAHRSSAKYLSVCTER